VHGSVQASDSFACIGAGTARVSNSEIRAFDTTSIQSRGGQLATRGPNVARHIVFSGPQKHSEKISNLNSSNLSQ